MDQWALLFGTWGWLLADAHRHPCAHTHLYSHSDAKKNHAQARTHVHTNTNTDPPLPPSETQKMYDLSAAWRLLLRTSTIPRVCNRWCVYCGRERLVWLMAMGCIAVQHETESPARKRKGYSGLQVIRTTLYTRSCLQYLGSVSMFLANSCITSDSVFQLCWILILRQINLERISDLWFNKSNQSCISQDYTKHIGSN